MTLHRLRQLPYLLSGLTGRLTHRVRCPACDSNRAVVVDRKGFHSLMECQSCHLMHRFPTETAAQMAEFYDHDYAEPGLTTELPTDTELQALLATGFAGSRKDFSHPIALLQKLGLPPGGRLLDYGANWGYGLWQFQRAGFAAQGFEISRPRAAFAVKLGVEVKTSLADVRPPFDAVYSSHVLEHVPNPLAALREQLALVVPGGLVVAHTPNGSHARAVADRRGFHRVWGQAHPVLLTERFVAHLADGLPFYVSSDDSVEALARWDRHTPHTGPMSGDGLLLVLVRG